MEEMAPMELDDRRWKWLNENHVSINDQRDPEGEERLHVAEYEALEKRYGRMAMPLSISGRNLRNEDYATDFVKRLTDEAIERMERWEAEETDDRPCVIVVSNYGASLHTHTVPHPDRCDDCGGREPRHNQGCPADL